MEYISITKPGLVEVLTKSVPVPKKNEALLKLLYGGICGSDLGTYRGTFAYSSYPCIPGHEISAQIIEIGENEYNLKPGMNITVNPYFNCGTCYSCRRGFVNCCMSNKTMGVQREGGFSQYLTIQNDRIIDGKGLDPKTLALIEPFCIGFHGVKKADIKKGEKVLVIGTGTVGILAALSAKIFGAKVYVCDISKEKLEYATRFGFDGFILNDGHGGLEEGLKKYTANDGFDVVIEAVGNPTTFQDSINMVAFCGRIILIGIAKANLDFFFTIIQKKEIKIFGSRNALTEDFIQLIDFCKDKKVCLDGIITNIYPYRNASQAFEYFSKNQGSVLKILLEF